MRAVHRITNSLVQEWIELFQRKSEDYNSDPMPGFPEGFENADVLGVRGQFAEIWRKIWKLYKGMWNGEQLTGEPTREVLMDLISHCFLAIDMLDRQELVQSEKFQGLKAKLEFGGEAFKEEAPKPAGTVRRRTVCGSACAMAHTYGPNCAQQSPARHTGGGML